ncbi:hypothetical protein [Archangium lansingense]|uniref:Lipoprotein n=1 Tax=Archangium lansingense TaxID=2995310 RepID=A0ABT4ABA7_9BACT|nr:hypothetical protein [Archangium lansinium]MCY1078963.1 hypothetical protein [Archangium lansinium]
MRRIGSALLALSLLAGCGGTEAEPSSESLERQQAPLTTTDVDVAPECQGILTFVNTATFAKLDAFLPSDVVTNLVNRRATSQFVSLADLLTVPLVGPARLEQIESGARTQGLIGASCVGIENELALSTDDAARMVSLVNSISSTELHDVLPYAWNGAVNLLATRPFTSVQGIANTTGIGSVSLRNIRNAATLSAPLETLIAAVNASVGGNGGLVMARHFDRWELLTGHGYYNYQADCFGFDDEDLPWGMTGDPTPVDGSVVYQHIAARVSSQLPIVTAGLANLAALTQNRTFKGCHVGYADDPWSSHSVTFFVDEETGFGVMTDSFWVE